MERPLPAEYDVELILNIENNNSSEPYIGSFRIVGRGNHINFPIFSMGPERARILFACARARARAPFERGLVPRFGDFQIQVSRLYRSLLVSKGNDDKTKYYDLSLIHI